MGVNDQQKFCKVTVHRTDMHRPWENAANARGVRSTIAYKQLTPDAKPKSKQFDAARWTATGAAAVDGLDMPTRRRAHTTAATMGLEPVQLSVNPMSRLTMRFEQESANKTDENSELEPLDASARNDSFLHCDTDLMDPVRHTFDEETKMFVPGTPPIPSGMSVDLLPTADFTPEIPSLFKRALDDAASDLQSQTDNSSAASSSPRESRIRISSPGKQSSLFGDHGYDDELPTPIMSSSVGTPLEDRVAPSESEFVHYVQDEPQAASPAEQLLPKLEVSIVPTNSYDEIHLSETKPEYLPQPMVETEQAEDDEQLVDDEADLSSFVEVDSDNEDEELDIDENAFDVCDNFDAILGEPLPNRGSRWRFSLGPKKSLVRQKRGMSSPPRMVSRPPPALARHMSVPSAYTPPHQTGESIRPKPIVHAPAGTPLYHGQMLHLNFKSSDGMTVQVSTQQRRSKSSMFSKLIECFSIQNEPIAEPEDALRIIAHTSDGDIRGGDRISLARGDGSVLRIQKMSKKLSFSPKIDMKAKFVVCGVPEGTVVTDTTKFYLQSVYDRTKTIGFLKDRRHPGAGCLVLYAYRTTDDVSEPIQFFKRADPPSFAQLHAAQQGHALQTSPLMGGFM